ncbi:negative regulation of DNA replication [Branchiostoma belcheri]|nr:negative regulation of DNA replication [Branchiostoma belcheri]
MSSDSEGDDHEILPYVGEHKSMWKMAAILKTLLDPGGDLSLEIVLQWLSQDGDGRPDVAASCDLLTCCSQDEFVVFFLNYLRDKTGHLLSGRQTAVQTPVKTPSSKPLKAKESSSVSRRPASTSRTQLFSVSPNPRPTADISNQNSSLFSQDLSICDSFTDGESSSHFSSILQNSSRNSPTPSPFHGRKTPREQKITLGEFLFKTPESGNKRKSPNPASHGRKDKDRGNYSASPHIGRKSGGKGKGTVPAETKEIQIGKRRSEPPPQPPVFNLGNMEDFPPMGSPSLMKITPSRRITPTPVTKDGSRPSSRVCFTSTPLSDAPNSPAAQDHSSLFSSPPKAVSRTSVLQEERELLKMERSRLLSDSGLTNADSPKDESQPAPCITPTKASILTPTKAALIRQSSVSETVADRNLVTHEDVICTLAELYSQCIQANLAPNLAVELHFTIQLLTIKGTGETGPPAKENLADPEDTNYLQSVHNCVLFATVVLEKQLRILSLLDKGTLRLLADNPRIGAFSPSLQQALITANGTCPFRTKELRTASPISSVPFQSDTDNRHNFPSDHSFHTFKKTRDKFYELLREWEDEHLKPDWSMQLAMGERIRILLHSTADFASLIHFARLFQSQLIRMCKGDSLQDQDVEEDIALLTELRKSNPEKLKRLQERFITPWRTGGPCPPPAFPGHQEFFKNFLQAAASHVFNQLIVDNFSAEIQELDTSQFGLPDNTADSVDQEQRDSYASCLLNLRILGKFLGFIVFLPYQSPQLLPESMMASALSVRNKVCQPIDIMKHLQDSLRQGRTILTIPWVVEYLSMMDPMAPKLDSYKEILSILLHIHRSIHHSPSSFLSTSQLLVLLMLGWLFQVPAILTNMITLHPDADELVVPNFNRNNCISLDSIQVVDQQLLYTCCPYLGELRAVLMEYDSGISSKGGSFRKITPLSFNQEPKEVSKQQIQLQLEESFFHNQPPSLKRTVDFVVERVSSNCAKHVRAAVVQTLVQGRREDLRTGIGDVIESEEKKLTKEERAREKTKATKPIITAVVEEARPQAEEAGKRFCETKVMEALNSLVAEEISPQVVKTAGGIAFRLANDKVVRWTRDKVPALIQKEVEAEYDRLLKQAAKQQACLPRTSAEAEEKPELEPSAVLEKLKDLLGKVFSPGGSQSVCESDFVDVLTKIRDLLQSSQEIFTSWLKSLSRLSVEAAAAYIIYSLGNQQSKVFSRLLEIWACDLPLPPPFQNLLAPKNILLLQQRSSNMQASWAGMAQILRMIVEKRLVSVHNVDSWWTSLLQNQSLQGYRRHIATAACDSILGCLSVHKPDPAEEEDGTFAELAELILENSGHDETMAGKVQQCIDLLVGSSDDSRP